MNIPLKMNPDFAKAHKDLGIIYLNKRLFDYAEEEFETALKLSPNDFDILLYGFNSCFLESLSMKPNLILRKLLQYFLIDLFSLLAMLRYSIYCFSCVRFFMLFCGILDVYCDGE